MFAGTVEIKTIRQFAIALLVTLYCCPIVNAQLSQTSKNTATETATPPISQPLEDLTTLSLSQSHLRQTTPILGEKAELPEFTREMIQVQWRPGDLIDLYVILPRNIKKPRAILYLYSYPSETNRFLDNQYCIRLTQGGYAAVGFVSALTGQRYHDRPMKEWFVSELHEALTTSVHDVQMVLDYLSARGDLDVSHVGFFGQGSGATIAILSATVDPRIGPLDLLDPWGDWPDWLAKSSLVPDEERSSHLRPEFLARLAPLDPVKWLPGLGKHPLRLQFVADDMTTPTVAQDRIASAAPAQTVVVRYQDTRSLFEQTSGGKLFDWVKNALRAPGPISAEATAKSVQSYNGSNQVADEFTGSLR